MSKTREPEAQDKTDLINHKQIASLLPQTVFEINLDGSLTFANNIGLRMFGYTREDYNKGLNVLNLLIPEDRERALADFKAVSMGDKGKGTEYTGLRKDGSTFSMIIYASTIIENSVPIGLRGFLIDIDERKRIEEELKESEHRFRNLAEKSLVGIYLIQDGVFSYVNSTFASIFGYKIEEMTGIMKPEDTACQDSKDIVKDKVHKRIENEVGSVHYQFKGITKQKQIIDVEVYGSRTLIKGKPAIIGSLIDITERKKSEGKLKLLSQRNELILNTAADGFQILNENGKILQVNPAFCEMTGYSAQELLQLNTNKLYLLNEVNFSAYLFDLNINERASHLFETRIKRKDDTIIDVEVHANCLRIESETMFFLSVRNITERINSAQMIKQLSTAVEQSPVTIVITDTDGRIEYVNKRFCSQTGYTSEEVIGKKTSLFKSGRHNQEFYKELWDTITDNRDWDGEFYNKKKNGEFYWEEARISPIVNENGVITHYLGVKADITKRKQAEIEVKNARKKTEELNRLKSSFLANMNHELRTPLIGILGFADILMEELKNPEQKEMADIILTSGRRLLECLNMILDLSRIEADDMQFEFVPVNIGQVVRDIYHSYNQSATDKNLEYTLYIKDDKLLSRIDSKVFTQIIGNILNNAIKFTEKGGVKVEIFSEVKHEKLFNIIKITDTGIGIAKEEQKFIFDEFRQAKEGLNRPYGGTGIGLTISKKYIELMGGSLKLESEPGVGSVFTICFPSLRRVTSFDLMEGNREQNKEFIRPRLLSVENDPASTKIIQYFLKNLCIVDHASTGEDALKLIQKNEYRAIMMDVNSGTGVEGLDAVKEIKKYPQCKDTPIIAVTAYAINSDKEKYLKNGCSHYLSKPFDKHVLVNLILEILKN
jgi:PAS domain S-box-containing protein